LILMGDWCDFFANQMNEKPGVIGRLCGNARLLRRGYHRDAGLIFSLDHGRLMGDTIA
jgi:hypothetical protein